MASGVLVELIKQIPKVELHLHIEGTFEPELVFAIAARNGIKLNYATVEELRAAYNFADLQTFLDIYYQGMSALIHEKDFYDLTYAYFARVHKDNVRHVELFFDPQGHTERSVPFATVVAGVRAAMKDAERDFGITSYLILSFLRHMSEESAFKTLEEAKPFLSEFIAVGLDSSEKNHPPGIFTNVYAECRRLGLRAVAHAGEEGPAAYITEALDNLKIERVDHGVRCMEDPAVVARLVEGQIPLTVCPLSNIKLRVFHEMSEHNLKTMLDQGLKVTVNSDDPAYFGGYMVDNYMACLTGLNLQFHDIVTLARNSIDASFLPGFSKVKLHQELSEAIRNVERQCQA